jgi:hypothetical protein
MTADTTPPILLIRHAEKPQPGEQGVGLDGQPDQRALSVTGWARAGALIGLFAPADGRPLVPHLARPGRLVAAACSDDHPSHRPRDTLTLLGAALDLPVEEHQDDDASLPALAESLRRSECTVLVSWRHGSLPRLAAELLQRPDAAPSLWPEQRFDLVWVVQRHGFSPQLVQVPQRLLAGDHTQTVARRVSSPRSRVGKKS